MSTLVACPGTGQPPALLDCDVDDGHTFGLCPVCADRVIVQYDRLIPHGRTAMQIGTA